LVNVAGHIAAQGQSVPINSRVGRGSVGFWPVCGCVASLLVFCTSVQASDVINTPGSRPVLTNETKATAPVDAIAPADAKASVVHHYHHFDKTAPKRADHGFHPFRTTIKTLENVELQMKG